MAYAVGVGTAHYSFAFRNTPTAMLLAFYRAIGIACVLDFAQPNLQESADYDNLESSEKANLSYWVGMTFTAIAADEILDIPRTMHASQLDGNGVPLLIPVANRTRSLADLVGEDGNGDWHALEAKGRGGNQVPTVQQRARWKNQSLTVATVDGLPITTRTYTIGFLGAPCRIEMTDPPSPPRTPVNLQFGRDDIRIGYYKPYVSYLSNGTTSISRQGHNYRVKPVAADPESGRYFYLGLDERFYPMGAQTLFQVTALDLADFYCGTNGIAVGLCNDPCHIS